MPADDTVKSNLLSMTSRYLLAHEGDLWIMHRVFGHNVKDTRILFGRVPQCRETCRSVIEKVFDLPNTSIKKTLSFSIERRYSYSDGGAVVTSTGTRIRLLTCF